MKKDFVFLMLTALGAACTTVVDFDVPFDKPKVVVNSLFSPDSVWVVKVTRSKYILDNSGAGFDDVADAIVTIRDQSNQLIETINGSYDTFHRYTYRGSTKPSPGQTYTVHVSVNNESNLQAANTVPTYVPITSVEIDSSRFKANGEPVEMDIAFKDPVDEKNYYEIKILQEMVSFFSETDTVWRTQEIYAEVVDPSFNNDFNDSEKFINDKLFNGKNSSFHIKMHGFGFANSNYIRHPRVVLLSVSEEYYNYFATKNLQESTNGDPFAQPVQVFTNIENGLGIFAGYSSSVVELN